jgi:NADH-quinone oxidoreductase subunit A
LVGEVVDMGLLDVWVIVLSVIILSVVVYNLLGWILSSDWLGRFGLTRTSRRDYYECGFRPRSQRPVKISLTFLLLCVFFLLYDIELVYLFPYVSGYTYDGGCGFSVFLVLLTTVYLSLCVDYERHALHWQL